MATTVITDAGVKLMTNLLSNKETCTFKELQLSSHTYSDEEIKSLTDTVEDVKQTVTFTGSTVTADKDAIKLTAVAENKEISETFAVNTMAIIVTGSVSGDIVYAAVSNSDAADIQPKYDGHSINRITYQFTVQVGAADNVTVTVVPEIVAESVSYNDADTSLDAANVQAAIEKLKQNADSAVASDIGVTDTDSYFGSQYSDLQTMIDNIIAQFKKIEQAIIDNKQATEYEIYTLVRTLSGCAGYPSCLVDDPAISDANQRMLENKNGKYKLRNGRYYVRTIACGTPESAYDPEYISYLYATINAFSSTDPDSLYLDFPFKLNDFEAAYKWGEDYMTLDRVISIVLEHAALDESCLTRDFNLSFNREVPRAVPPIPKKALENEDHPDYYDYVNTTVPSYKAIPMIWATRGSLRASLSIRIGSPMTYRVSSSDGDWDLVAILAGVNSAGDSPLHTKVRYDYASLTFLIWADYKGSVGPMLGDTVLTAQAEAHWTPIPEAAVTGLDYNTLTFYNTAYYYQLQHVIAPNAKKMFDEYIGQDKYVFFNEYGPKNSLTWSYPYISSSTTCPYSTPSPDLRVRPLFLEDIVGPQITAYTALSTGINAGASSDIPRPLNTKEIGDHFLPGWHHPPLALFQNGRSGDAIREAFRLAEINQSTVVGSPSISKGSPLFWWLGNNFLVDSSQKGGKDYYYALVGGEDAPQSTLGGVKMGLGSCSIGVTNQSLDEPETQKTYARYVGVTTLVSLV